MCKEADLGATCTLLVLCACSTHNLQSSFGKGPNQTMQQWVSNTAVLWDHLRKAWDPSATQTLSSQVLCLVSTTAERQVTLYNVTQTELVLLSGLLELHTQVLRLRHFQASCSVLQLLLCPKLHNLFFPVLHTHLHTQTQTQPACMYMCFRLTA